MTKSVQHGRHELVITIPTESPAELHALLMRAINVSIKQLLLHPVEIPEDRFLVASLTDLQSALLPGVRELEKIHNY